MKKIIKVPEITLGKDPEPIIDYGKMYNDAYIDLKQSPKKPPTALELNGLIFGTFGNLSLIKGGEKARKTWLKSLVIASALGGNSNELSGMKSKILQDKYVIDLDTEQDEFYSWLSAYRIPRIYGSVSAPKLPENYKPFKLREYTKRERRGFLQWLFMESDIRNEIGFVSIDGIVDMIVNFNDLVECDDFTQEVMRYSTKAKAHIMGVLHVNPESDKARGHIGTLFQQKCETIVMIKDEGVHSLVKCERARGEKFSDFKLEINSDKLPQVINDNTTEDDVNKLMNNAAKTKSQQVKVEF